uniref:Uncharacterized protein n=1 Tax=Melanopsichium pennsylvanicum 4 TaxID=1398559 RepID=A0A077QZF6_9BASI|nr:uncharacterized protein BN887_06290 [Melanopsichium pennsylvanicum 4]
MSAAIPLFHAAATISLYRDNRLLFRIRAQFHLAETDGPRTAADVWDRDSASSGKCHLIVLNHIKIESGHVDGVRGSQLAS